MADLAVDKHSCQHIDLSLQFPVFHPVFRNIIGYLGQTESTNG